MVRLKLRIKPDIFSGNYAARVEGNENLTMIKSPIELAKYFSEQWESQRKVLVSTNGEDFLCVNSNQYKSLLDGRLDAFSKR